MDTLNERRRIVCEEIHSNNSIIRNSPNKSLKKSISQTSRINKTNKKIKMFYKNSSHEYNNLNNKESIKIQIKKTRDKIRVISRSNFINKKSFKNNFHTTFEINHNKMENKKKKHLNDAKQNKEFENSNFKNYKELILKSSSLNDNYLKRSKSEIKIYGRKLIIILSRKLKLNKKILSIYQQNRRILNRDKNLKKNSKFLTHDKIINEIQDKKNEMNDFNNVGSSIFLSNKKIKNMSNPRHLKQLNKVLGNDLNDVEDDVIEKNSEEEKFFFSSCLINHESLYKILWDLIIFFSVLYSVLILPVNLCFYDNKSESKIIEMMIEFLFLLDLNANFISTYRNHDEDLIIDKNEIFKKYLSSWFVYDLIFSLPFELIFFIYNRINYKNDFTFLKWLKVLRLAKLFREKSTGRFINYPGLNKCRLFNLAIFCLFFIHISSCIFLFIGINAHDNWLNRSNIKNNYLEMYIASLYYTVSTILPIGYGDIIPCNYSERVWSIMLMIIGVFIYLNVISLLSNFFLENNNKYIHNQKKLILLYSLNEQFKLPAKLFSSIHTIIKNEGSKKGEDSLHEFLETLPLSIKKEIAVIRYQANICRLDCFKNKSDQLIKFVIPMLKKESFFIGDILLSPGNSIEEMFFVIKGCLSINLDLYYDYIEMDQLRKNNHFGDLLMYLDINCQYQVICKNKFTNLFLLSKKDFFFLKKFYNDEISKMLEESSKFMMTLEEKSQFLKNNYKFYRNKIQVKKMMKEMDRLLFEKGFDYFYENGVDCPSVNNYYFNSQEKEVLNIIEGNNNNYNSKIFTNPKVTNEIYMKKANSDTSKDYIFIDNHTDPLHNKKETIDYYKIQNNKDQNDHLFQNDFSRVETFKQSENEGFGTIHSKLNKIFCKDCELICDKKAIDLFSLKNNKCLNQSENKHKKENHDKCSHRSQNVNYNICNNLDFSIISKIPQIYSIQKAVDFNILQNNQIIHNYMKIDRYIPISILEISIIPNSINIVEKNINCFDSIKNNLNFSTNLINKNHIISNEEQNFLQEFNKNKSFSEENKFHILSIFSMFRKEEYRLKYLVEILGKIDFNNFKHS